MPFYPDGFGREQIFPVIVLAYPEICTFESQFWVPNNPINLQIEDNSGYTGVNRCDPVETCRILMKDIYQLFGCWNRNMNITSKPAQ